MEHDLSPTQPAARARSSRYLTKPWYGNTDRKSPKKLVTIDNICTFVYTVEIARGAKAQSKDESMVEIKNTEEGRSPSPLEDISDEGVKYRLLYSKSKVYVQPTAYAKDNIPGFAVLVKRVDTLSGLFTFIADLHM